MLGSSHPIFVAPYTQKPKFYIGGSNDSAEFTSLCVVRAVFGRSSVVNFRNSTMIIKDVFSEYLPFP
jgi:hypothetical protein